MHLNNITEEHSILGRQTERQTKLSAFRSVLDNELFFILFNQVLWIWQTVEHKIKARLWVCREKTFKYLQGYLQPLYKI